MPNNELTGEPALYAATVSAGIQMAAAFWLPLTVPQIAIINALVLAIAGVYVAFATKAVDNGGSVKAALLGLTQAGISLALTFGWDATNAQVAALMGFVGLVLAVFIRQTSEPASALSRAA